MDELILDRIRNCLDHQGITWIEKKMFGGHCFMIDDKMCFATIKNGLLARVGPDALEELIELPGAEQMVMGNNRTMKGYLLIENFAIESENALDFWVQKCLDYNPLAVSTRKKKKK